MISKTFDEFRSDCVRLTMIVKDAMSFALALCRG